MTPEAIAAASGVSSPAHIILGIGFIVTGAVLIWIAWQQYRMSKAEDKFTEEK